MKKTQNNMETRKTMLLSVLLVVGVSLLIPSLSQAEDPPPFITKWGSQGAGDGQFFHPQDVAVDSSGNVYVADTQNSRIQKFDSNGNFQSSFVLVNQPYGIAVDSEDNVYVAINNHRIQKFDSDGNFLAQWGSYGSGDGNFIYPRGIAVDSEDNVYVTEVMGNDRVQKFSSTGTFITKWGSKGSGEGNFVNPLAIAVDGEGNVYVADTHNFRVQKFSSTGTFITKWGKMGPAHGEFYDPRGIAVDSSNNVYVTENHHISSRIQKFTSEGVFLTKWGGPGTGDGQFYKPKGITVDSSNNVFVVETGRHRIQKFGTLPANMPPVADAGPDQTVEATSPAGASVALDGSGSTDPDSTPGTNNDILFFDWYEGDASLGIGEVIDYDFPLGSHTVTLVVADFLEETNSDELIVVVEDTTPPEITNDAPEPYGLYAEGDLAFDFSAYDLVSGEIEPPYLLGTLSDPSGFSGTVVPGDAPGGGVYTLLVSAVDEAGNEANETVLFVVFDPSDGFVTGGGWIDSPSGAYTPGDPDDDDLTGMANFGFVSKYKKGANVPTGNTEFQFKTADLNFHSSSYDWLVVTGSDCAKFKGIGTINGEGSYKFMLWAGDSDPDTFRIKIWEEVGEIENVVYDNGKDQAIGGGSIVIHAK